MVKPILKYGAPELETVCEPVTQFDAELSRLAEDMLETMYAAPGIGLAAPQIGVTKRLIVIDISGGDLGHQVILANPKVEQAEGVQKGEEGCLSIPGFTAMVARPERVIVRGQDLEGQPVRIEADDLLARALCHEIDHINGVLYLSHVSRLKRDLILRKIKKLVRAGEW